ncbi:hypothetical protein GIS00_15755 [Nakamurella sp. YIM 132087]|uniref:VWA domain-containing protein n=1 Tax=Nakamurella alba TaxID=2665158 RepID=A0A7K1FQ70_9ACTN|nr:hypothetical protein [Nakamurella alba]MTD15393.1 hypothetical protein [Nakamurella alba]
MGHGRWDDNTWAAAASYRRARGIDDFQASGDMHRRPRQLWAADPALEPKGVSVRESRDSADHPISVPIAVLFDVTGSMGRVPRILQQQLATLHGLLKGAGLPAEPQVMFGGIGDAETDQVPLQVGQFESDNRMDDQLRALFLEGGGGGQKSESYELAGYFMGAHVSTDSWEQRGEKGFLFLIGDELNKSVLSPAAVREVLGDEIPRPVPVARLYADLQQRWHVFFLLPAGTSYYNDREIARHWTSLLGDGFIKVPDVEQVVPTIVDLVAERTGAAGTGSVFGTRPEAHAGNGGATGFTGTTTAARQAGTDLVHHPLRTLRRLALPGGAR